MEADGRSVDHDDQFGAQDLQVACQLVFVGFPFDDPALVQGKLLLLVDKAFHVGNKDRIQVLARHFVDKDVDGLLVVSVHQLVQDVAGELDGPAVAGMVELVVVVVGLGRLVESFQNLGYLVVRLLGDLLHHQ